MDIEDLAMLLHTIDVGKVTPSEFSAASLLAKSLGHKLDQSQQLILYGLFKQASEGDINIPEPENTLSQEFYKWEAWKSFYSFPKEDAAKAYIYIINTLKNDECFPESLNGLSNKRDISGVGVIVSTLYCDYDDSLQWLRTGPESLFEAVVSNNMDKVVDLILEGCEVNSRDPKGMTPLHYAADRGFVDICKSLLDAGANINSFDESGQTPLMFATICDHVDVAKLLLSQPLINLSAVNNDGDNAEDLCDPSSAILDLILAKRGVEL